MSGKNIIICSDGTGNADIKARGTNVFKLFEAVDLHHPQQRQLAYYDAGVGTSGFKPLQLLGGAVGLGLAANVRQLYTELARVYEPGDRLYLFGFSRGAFTVRTLAGIITECGIPGPESWTDEAQLRARVAEAWRSHRARYQYFQATRGTLARAAAHSGVRRAEQLLRLDPRKGLSKVEAVRNSSTGGQVPIRFLGVWDTVDAVGLPFDFMADLLNEFYPFKFPDLQLSSWVEKACHALAIDDERVTFHPVMWDEGGRDDPRLEQVWFAGMHSNVGGGYSKQGMSLVALDWMMEKAEAAGLCFVDSARKAVREHRNWMDCMYDSRAGLASFYRYGPRDIAAISRAHGIVKPKIHDSVFERIRLGTQGYAPGQVPAEFELVHSAHPCLEPEAARDLPARHADLRRAEEPRFRRAARWVAFGRYTHTTLFAIAALALYCWSEVSGLSGMLRQLGSALSPAGAWQLLKQLWTDPALRLVLALLVLLPVFWLEGKLARRVLGDLYSAFWRKLFRPRPAVRAPEP